MRTEIHFLLNDREVCAHAPAALTVLDYLRGEARATGTKEGCREGECGACAVLVGERAGERVRYRPVTSCLMPIAELAGRHLVTIEGLNQRELTPVQQAIVDAGASQCGFCTPGIVVSLTGLLLTDGAARDAAGVDRALSGHICRCTGYASLRASGARLCRELDGAIGVEALVAAGVVPPYFTTVAERLRRLPRPAAAAGPAPAPRCHVAGGTDLYVQRGDDLAEGAVDVLNLRQGMRGVRRDGGVLRIGALTTFEELAADPEVVRLVPDVGAYMHLIASWQLRERATVGGNLVNASPIGDLTILFLALGAHLELRRGEARRTLPLAAFYRGYKELAKAADEVVTEIAVPLVPEGVRVSFEKVSKRQCLDVAAVNSALALRTDGETVAAAALAVGGVAPVPLLLRRTSAWLVGRPLGPDTGPDTVRDTVRGAVATAQREISPISDVRGSADYKRLLVRQQLIAHFARLAPATVALEELYAAP